MSDEEILLPQVEEIEALDTSFDMEMLDTSFDMELLDTSFDMEMLENKILEYCSDSEIQKLGNEVREAYEKESREVISRLKRRS